MLYLAEQSKHVVFDLTRCQLKVRELSELLPGAHFLHLTRSERAFASSHLLPTRKDLRGRAQRILLERDFFTRRVNYDFWGMESLCGTARGSKISLLLERGGYDVDGFYQLPAVGRLIVLHRFMTAEAGRALRETGRSATVRFEDYVDDPRATVARACHEAGAPAPEPASGLKLSPASPGHRPSDARWDDVLGALTTVCPQEAQR